MRRVLLFSIPVFILGCLAGSLRLGEPSALERADLVSRASYDYDTFARDAGRPRSEIQHFRFVAGTEVTEDGQPAAPKPSIALQLAGALADLLMTAALGLIGMLIAYLRSKAATDKAARIGLVFAESSRAVVLELDRTIKPKLKAFLADGVLSDEEKAELKKTAVDLMKAKLPAGVLAAAGEVFGAAFLDTYLGGKIEQAVMEKNAMASAGEKPGTITTSTEIVASPPEA